MQIQSTIDYNLFLRIPGNRKVYTNQLKRLYETIKHVPELLAVNPILVNENMEIIDGQHRLEVCKKLDIPVYFIKAEGLTLADVQMLNSNRKPWTPVDTAESFKEQGNKNYAYYLDFKREYGFNHEIIMRYLSIENSCTTEAFKDGKFKVSNVKQSEALLNWLTEMGRFYEKNVLRSFALGFFKIATSNLSEYNHQRMVKQMEKYGHQLLSDHSIPVEYCADLEKIYNFRLAEKNHARLY